MYKPFQELTFVLQFPHGFQRLICCLSVIRSCFHNFAISLSQRLSHMIKSSFPGINSSHFRSFSSLLLQVAIQRLHFWVTVDGVCRYAFPIAILHPHKSCAFEPRWKGILQKCQVFTPATQLLQSLHPFPVLFHNPYTGSNDSEMQDDRRCTLQSTGQNKQLKHLPVVSRPSFSVGGTSSVASGTSYGSRGVFQGLRYCTEHNEKKYTRTTGITVCRDTQFHRETHSSHRVGGGDTKAPKGAGASRPRHERRVRAQLWLNTASLHLFAFPWWWMVSCTSYKCLCISSDQSW